jgi:hypothetical protein
MDDDSNVDSLAPEPAETERVGHSQGALGEHGAQIWGTPPSEPAAPGRPDQEAPTEPVTTETQVRGETPPESQWWPSPSPIPSPEPPPAHRGRSLAIALVVLLLAAGGVTAVVVATSNSRRGAEATSPSSSFEQPGGIPAAPASFTAQAASGGEIDLSWAAPPPGPSVSGYNVFREGQLIAQPDATATTYRDYGVGPSSTFTYAIEAVSGSARSIQSTLVVSTPKAPALSAARVTGGFNIKGSFTKENFTNRQDGEKYESFWFFTPTCSGSDACTVKTSGEGEGKPQRLKLKRGTYSGAIDIPHGGQCGSKKLTETQTIEFTVVKAAFTNGIWEATKISGTSRFDVPSTARCRAGFGVVTFTGAVAG